LKCRKCGRGAVIELRRHNAAFCEPDFVVELVTITAM